MVAFRGVFAVFSKNIKVFWIILVIFYCGRLLNTTGPSVRAKTSVIFTENVGKTVFRLSCILTKRDIFAFFISYGVLGPGDQVPLEFSS